MQQGSSTPGFDPSSPRYMCCRNRLPAVTGAGLLGAFWGLGVGCRIFMLLGEADSGGHLIFLFIFAAAIASLFWGLRVEKARALLPAMCISVLFAVVVIIYAGYMFLRSRESLAEQNPNLAGLPDSELKDRLTATVHRLEIKLGVICLVAAALNIWFFLVLEGAYHYLNEKPSGDQMIPLNSAAAAATTSGGGYQYDQPKSDSSYQQYAAPPPPYMTKADGAGFASSLGQIP